MLPKNIVSPHRYYIREGKFKVANLDRKQGKDFEKIYVFLCNDLLLTTKKVSGVFSFSFWFGRLNQLLAFFLLSDEKQRNLLLCVHIYTFSIWNRVQWSCVEKVPRNDKCCENSKITSEFAIAFVHNNYKIIILLRCLFLLENWILLS